VEAVELGVDGFLDYEEAQIDRFSNKSARQLDTDTRMRPQLWQN
jgi:hypothetical protein